MPSTAPRAAFAESSPFVRTTWGDLVELLLPLAVAAGMIGLATAFWTASFNAPPDAERSLLIRTSAPRLDALQVEQQITFPVERAVRDLPGIDDVVSFSSRGQSDVVIICVSPEARRDLRPRVAATLPTDLPAGIGRPRLIQTDDLSAYLFGGPSR